MLSFEKFKSDHPFQLKERMIEFLSEKVGKFISVISYEVDIKENNAAVSTSFIARILKGKQRIPTHVHV